ncbi:MULTISPECIES: ASCH domain-containing protein [unclassified Pseudomonas]|uniref:ASCH domain-containing protein n=1 Tax=unclassified Pseudomonas TaxID=196821 RepID=UPI000D332EAC|nr:MULTISPECIES: ASCH domain-containing protein [unclassified Pseudomonas]RAU48780.1 ASCH domain-containing protein [Pseudomonas sp. RIT 409]RAU53960.1 ASCH domain-containing protein [Pseudomonas sp. RIT 412]
MKVLLSIKPEYAEKILAGTKRFEFRKAIFKNPSVKTVVIYATLPIGKVIGEFDFDVVLSDKPEKIWQETKKHSGISKKFFSNYFDGRSTAHAIAVREVRRYDMPLDLIDIIPSGCAPQSFCYLNESTGIR